MSQQNDTINPHEGENKDILKAFFKEFLIKNPAINVVFHIPVAATEEEQNRLNEFFNKIGKREKRQ